ncbi:VOC family protein [Kibdelosporangium aridum]|uniref:VOC family protein n=1 Tax=Kibdelosporangium aridum TaxID=2030 RepID=A0A428YXK3_KIBAR|nr:VOC family protein [Kibdelosporangium aridum]RSM75134.1 VOC family protein [Kibdelosporangium aridum]
MSGEVNWFELAVDDTAKATKFYGAVLGWQTAPFEGQDYHLVTNGAAGAIAPKSAELPASRVYFHVADLDATLTKIGELGGKPGDTIPIPGFGRISHCQDDQGTSFSLFQPN